jgi:hypothetical protein
MANIRRDDNQVEVMSGVLNTDGETPTLIKIDPVTHILQASCGTDGSDFGSDNASRDSNGTPVLIATSSSDGITPVPIYVDSSGNLLIKST